MTATLPIPTSGAELAEMLADTKRMGDLFAEAQAGRPEQFQEFITNYARSVQEKDQGIAAQVREQVQLTLAEMYKAAGAEGPPADLTPEKLIAQVEAKGRKQSAIYNRNAPGAKLDDVFDTRADFFQATWHGAGNLRNSGDLLAKRAKVTEVQNAFGSTVPSDGGFLIPETLRSELLAISLENSVVRSRATTIPMDSLRVPIPTVDDTSHASSVYGGVIGYWTEEAAALTSSSATFGRVVLDAKKLTTYSEVPNELIADAPAFDAFIGKAFPAAIAYFEDVAFISGSGAGEPLGFRNGSGLISVTRAGGGNDIDYLDIVTMYSRMLPSSLSTAVWVASPKTLISLLQLTVSGATIPLWLTNSQAFDAPTLQIFGRPLIITEKVPNSGTAGDLNFVDFSQYLIGDRQSMQAMSSPHYKFANDQTAYRIIERVDGRPWLNTALTPRNSGDTLSPYIQLS